MFQRRHRVKAVTVDPHSGDLVSPWPFFGLILVAAAFFLYVASGLLVPWWAWLLLVFVWLVLLPPSLRDWGKVPMRPVTIGLVLLIVWIGVVVGGGAVFHWDPWWSGLSQD